MKYLFLKKKGLNTLRNKGIRGSFVLLFFVVGCSAFAHKMDCAKAFVANFAPKSSFDNNSRCQAAENVDYSSIGSATHNSYDNAEINKATKHIQLLKTNIARGKPLNP